MNKPAFRNWQGVQEEVLRRIHAREWKPGEMIPNEADLAEEFGCARTTVNRALRTLAENGLLDRRRRAGTRVASQPVARATLNIPVIRSEIEGRGRKYGFKLLSRAKGVPSPAISAAMKTETGAKLLRVAALHLADDEPHALEDRWINLATVPGAADEPFEAVNANEWLLAHAPYTRGEIAFSAETATSMQARALHCPEGSALFTLDRLTWDFERSVTKVRLMFAPGYRMRANL